MNARKNKAFSPDLLRDLHAEPALRPIIGNEPENDNLLDNGAAIVLPPLSNHEEKRLQECESIITKGLATFIDVGNALAEIRNRGLYRADHKTFESYCHDRWNLKRQRAYELMGASEVVKNLSEISDMLPKKESHAAVLLKLSPEEQREVWLEVMGDAAFNPVSLSKLTASGLQKKVDDTLKKSYSATEELNIQNQQNRKEMCSALRKSSSDIKVSISGSWLVKNNLDHIWREVRSVSQSIDNQYSDEVTLQELLDLGILKINK
jgi:hypothetical protein